LQAEKRLCQLVAPFREVPTQTEGRCTISFVNWHKLAPSLKEEPLAQAPALARGRRCEAEAGCCLPHHQEALVKPQHWLTPSPAKP